MGCLYSNLLDTTDATGPRGHERSSSDLLNANAGAQPLVTLLINWHQPLDQSLDVAEINLPDSNRRDERILALVEQ